MGIPIAGNGYQVGAGNLSEPVLGVMATPQTATATATLTVLQILGLTLIGNPSTTAATYTLPTVASMEAVLGTVKTGTTFELNIINLGTSTGIITVAAGTGWTLVGMVTLPITAAAGSSATFRACKTGYGAWTLYRVA